MPDDKQRAQIEFDAQMLGISPDELMAGLPSEKEEPDDFPVWPENVLAVDLFIACRTQWRILSGFDRAVYAGLDYPGVEAVIRNAVKKKRRALFADLQVMEWAALEVLNAT